MEEMIKSIPVEKIKDDVYKQRVAIEGEDLDALAASIGRIGIIAPLLLAEDGDKFVIVAGHRRYHAALICGLKNIPGIVRKSIGIKAQEINIAENLFRVDLTPVEQACAIEDLLRSKTMGIDEVARLMHRSTDWLRRQVALLAWPDDVLDVVHSGKMSVSAASNLAMVEEPTYRAFLLKQALENGATARTTAAWLQAWRSSAPPAEAIKAEPMAPGSSITPAVPQAPCLACGEVYRTDELSHVPVCVHCIKAIRIAHR